MLVTRAVAEGVVAKIYTKVGDGGFTATLAGEMLKKNHPVVVANGKLDSLQASLDFARYVAEREGKTVVAGEIDFIQDRLRQAGGEISAGKTGGAVKNPVVEGDAEKLEKLIDAISEGKEFKRFVRFRTHAGMAFNEARVRCREAEIALVPLLESGRIRRELFKFVNRLGDFLYAAACDMESGFK